MNEFIISRPSSQCLGNAIFDGATVSPRYERALQRYPGNHGGQNIQERPFLAVACKECTGQQLSQPWHSTEVLLICNALYWPAVNARSVSDDDVQRWNACLNMTFYCQYHRQCGMIPCGVWITTTMQRVYKNLIKDAKVRRWTGRDVFRQIKTPRCCEVVQFLDASSHVD